MVEETKKFTEIKVPITGIDLVRIVRGAKLIFPDEKQERQELVTDINRGSGQVCTVDLVGNKKREHLYCLKDRFGYMPLTPVTSRRSYDLT